MFWYQSTKVLWESLEAQIVICGLAELLWVEATSVGAVKCGPTELFCVEATSIGAIKCDPIELMCMEDTSAVYPSKGSQPR